MGTFFNPPSGVSVITACGVAMLASATRLAGASGRGSGDGTFFGATSGVSFVAVWTGAPAVSATTLHDLQ